MTPEMLDPKITRFIILSHGRSGTMMLTDALDQLPQVHFFNLFAANLDRPHQYWLNWERFQQQENGVTHLGTTMHRVGSGWLRRFEHIPVETFWREIRDRHEKYICLRRHNVLRQLLSRKVGQVLGSYEVDKPRERQPDPVEIPIQELTEYVNELEFLQSTIDPQLPGRLDLAFEDLAENWGLTMVRIADYLGLPEAMGLQPVTVRQETRSLEEAIANYDEVATWCWNNDKKGWLD